MAKMEPCLLTIYNHKNNTFVLVLKIYDAYKIITSSLEEHYHARESRSIALILMGISSIELISNPDKIIEMVDFEKKLERLKNHEPVQYIVGHEEFYGRTFRVTPDTLIPRPETEELVQLIIKNHSNHNLNRPLRILDIGTGSGAIGITIALELKNCHVETWDISPKAIKIANENAHNLGAHNITFSLTDTLNIDEVELRIKHLTKNNAINQAENSHLFDIIVSNPPYIKPSEKAFMRNNVTQHEPHSALFVPEDDPLLFYRAITKLCCTTDTSAHKFSILAPEGALYFEINEAYPNECCQLLSEHGFMDVNHMDDLFGKPRIVYGKLL